MRRGGLRTIYITDAPPEDAAAGDTVAVVSGAYSGTQWNCIWCAQDQILVCGVEPQCGAPGDSID
jgi:hypothetical protein